MPTRLNLYIFAKALPDYIEEQKKQRILRFQMWSVELMHSKYRYIGRKK